MSEIYSKEHVREIPRIFSEYMECPINISILHSPLKNIPLPNGVHIHTRELSLVVESWHSLIKSQSVSSSIQLISWYQSLLWNAGFGMHIYNVKSPYHLFFSNSKIIFTLDSQSYYISILILNLDGRSHGLEWVPNLLNHNNGGIDIGCLLQFMTRLYTYMII